MENLKRKLLAGALLLCVASAGVFAQRGDDNKRPPKGQDKVVVKPKERPPANNNQGGDKNKGGDKKGKGD